MSKSSNETVKLVPWYLAPFKDVVLHSDYDFKNEELEVLRKSKNSTITALNKIIDSSKESIDSLKKELELSYDKISSLNELRKEDGRKLATLQEELNEALGKVASLEEEVNLLRVPVEYDEEIVESVEDTSSPVEEEEPMEDPVEESKLDRSNTSFKKKEVAKIFELRCKNMKVSAIADELNTRTDLVEKVLAGKTYKRFGLYAKYKDQLPK